MSLVVVCECGSKLEIDAGYKGRVITCPDCSRPIRIHRPSPRMHGLALLSLGASILGFLTVIGSLAGAASGYVAQQRIEREPGRWGGLELAKAGMYVGIAGLLVTVLLHFMGESIGIDGFLRELHGPANWITPPISRSKKR